MTRTYLYQLAGLNPTELGVGLRFFAMTGLRHHVVNRLVEDLEHTGGLEHLVQWGRMVQRLRTAGRPIRLVYNGIRVHLELEPASREAVGPDSAEYASEHLPEVFCAPIFPQPH